MVVLRCEGYLREIYGEAFAYGIVIVSEARQSFTRGGGVCHFSHGIKAVYYSTPHV